MRSFKDVKELRKYNLKRGSHFNVFCPKCGTQLPSPIEKPMDVQVAIACGGFGFTAFCDCGWQAPQHL
jgi:hypothetical protein